MQLTWIPDLIWHVRDLAQLRSWWEMPATRGNQLMEMLLGTTAVVTAVSVLYGFLKRVATDVLSSLRKIHVFLEKIDRRFDWLDKLQNQYPDVAAVIEKLRKINGDH